MSLSNKDLQSIAPSLNTVHTNFPSQLGIPEVSSIYFWESFPGCIWVISFLSLRGFLTVNIKLECYFDVHFDLDSLVSLKQGSHVFGLLRAYMRAIFFPLCQGSSLPQSTNYLPRTWTTPLGKEESTKKPYDWLLLVLSTCRPLSHLTPAAPNTYFLSGNMDCSLEKLDPNERTSVQIIWG